MKVHIDNFDLLLDMKECFLNIDQHGIVLTDQNSELKFDLNHFYYYNYQYIQKYKKKYFLEK